VIGPGAAKPLSLDIPIFVSDMSFGALSEEAKQSLLTTLGEPRPESPSTAECATVFGQLEMLSGESQFRPEKGDVLAMSHVESAKAEISGS
jgi:hypothetical protein